MGNLILKEKILVKGITFDIKIEVKENLIDYVTLETRDMITFSMSASKKGIGCGQIREKLVQKLKGGKFNPYCSIDEKEILLNVLDLWETYHLNDLKAGIFEQEFELMINKKNHVSYEEQCEHLKKKNMYNIDGHIYGYNWYCKRITTVAVKEIIKHINDLKKIRGAKVLLYKENLDILQEKLY